jgi:hypothetical protein
MVNVSLAIRTDKRMSNIGIVIIMPTHTASYRPTYRDQWREDVPQWPKCWPASGVVNYCPAHQGPDIASRHRHSDNQTSTSRWLGERGHWLNKAVLFGIYDDGHDGGDDGHYGECALESNSRCSRTSNLPCSLRSNSPVQPKVKSPMQPKVEPPVQPNVEFFSAA